MRARGIEPLTIRSGVESSTIELCPLTLVLMNRIRSSPRTDELDIQSQSKEEGLIHRRPAEDLDLHWLFGKGEVETLEAIQNRLVVLNGIRGRLSFI